MASPIGTVTDRRVRVLHVAREAEGGMALHVRTLVGGLDDRRFQVMLAGPPKLLYGEESAAGGSPCHDESTEPEFREGGRSHRTDLPIGDGMRFLPDMKAVVGLAQLIRDERPHLLHLHGYKAGLVGRVALAAAGVRLEQGRRAGSAMGDECTKVVLTLHNFPPERRGGLRQMLDGIAVRSALQVPHAVVTVSEALARYVAPLAPSKVTTIYNGIEPSGFKTADPFAPDWAAFRRAFRLSPEAVVVGTVARLIPAKGVHVLIEAAEQLRQTLPDVRWVIVGDGPARAELESRVRERDLNEFVRFLGFRNDVPRMLSTWNLFVLPSLSEGQSVTALEAMASGLPVIASRVGGLPEVVVDGRTGLLFPAEEHKALADAVIHVLSNPSAARAMGVAGRQRVATHFSLANMMQRTQALYDELLQPITLTQSQ